MKKLVQLFVVAGAALALFFALSATASAAPVWGRIFSCDQPDGASVDVKVFGDEYYRWMESPDGYTLIEDPQTGYMCYALLNGDKSDFVSTGVVYTGGALNLSMMPPVMTKGLALDSAREAEKVREAKEILAAPEDLDDAESAAAAPGRAAVSGEPEAIIGITLVIDFPDKTMNEFGISRDDVYYYLNQKGYAGFNNNGSVRDYFFDVSGEKVDYINKVFFYEAPEIKSFYGNNEDMVRTLILGALRELAGYNPPFTVAYEHIPLSLGGTPDSFLNCLTQLTQTGAGNIRALNILYAGGPPASNLEGLWPHVGYLPNRPNINEYYFYNFQVTPTPGQLELRFFAHENGHMLFGFPETYDIIQTRSKGLGDACLMAYGGALGNISGELNPVPPTAFLRYYVGWGGNELNAYPNESTITLAKNAVDAYIYKTPLRQEYFMTEYIVREARYNFFPGDGVVIYHIDDENPNNMNYEVSSDGAVHPYIYVEPADFLVHGSPSMPSFYNFYPPNFNGVPYNTFTAKSFSDGEYQSVDPYAYPNLLFPDSLLWDGRDSGLNMTDIILKYPANDEAEFTYNNTLSDFIYDITSAFDDDIFKAKVCQEIGKTADDQIYHFDVMYIPKLYVENRFNNPNQYIYSLAGLGYFTGLEELFCNFNQLTSLPDLPAGLTLLNCSSNQLTWLPALPDGLTTLSCYNNQLLSLPELPVGLSFLNCSNNCLIDLDATGPTALGYINCLYNYIGNKSDVMGIDPDSWDVGNYFFTPQNTGVEVSGQIHTYNPSNPTTIQLKHNNTVIHTVTIPATSGFGQQTQPFSFTNVAPGTYDLVITKAAHTSFTVLNVEVDDEDIDLTQHSAAAVQCMTLLCGDINGDQMINDNDLIVLWSAANYNKNIEQAANPLCDLNGDGVINDNDLIILWSAVNYNKGPVVIDLESLEPVCVPSFTGESGEEPESPAFSVRLQGALDSSVTFNSQSTLVLDWQFAANWPDLALRGVQGLRLAYDNTVLKLVRWDAASAIDDDGWDTAFTRVANADSAGVYPENKRVYAARDGGVGYLCLTLGDPDIQYECVPDAFASLLKVRFAFQDGKSAADLNSDSIRCMTVEELDGTNQSSAVMLNTAEAGGAPYYYLAQAYGVLLGIDTLDAPIFVLPS